MSANALGPLDSLAKPCSMKPYPTIRRSGIGAQRAIGNRLDNSLFLLLSSVPSHCVTWCCSWERQDTDSGICDIATNAYQHSQTRTCSIQRDDIYKKIANEHVHTIIAPAVYTVLQ